MKTKGKEEEAEGESGLSTQFELQEGDEAGRAGSWGRGSSLVVGVLHL
jgi:hypothetical protein